MAWYRCGGGSEGGGGETINPFQPTGLSFSNSNSDYSLTDTSFLPLVDFSRMTSLNGLFNNCAGITEVKDFNGVSNIANTQNMFNRCFSLIRASVLGLGNMTTAESTFIDCNRLEYAELSFTASNCNLYNMFKGCSSITEIDMSGVTGTASKIGRMFRYCATLQKLDISALDITSATFDTGTFEKVPADCLIIVKDEANKTFIETNWSNLTNVQIKEA